MTQVKPAITFLNLTGDVTITWDEQNKDAILELVRAKMQEGFTFFILKPVLFGILGTQKVRAKSLAEIKAAGSAVIDDKEFSRIMARLHDPAVESAVHKGHASLARSAEAVTSIDTARKAKTAEDVVAHQTVAIRRVVAG